MAEKSHSYHLVDPSPWPAQPTPEKQVVEPILVRYASVRTLSPGNSFPSNICSEAPPTVET